METEYQEVGGCKMQKLSCVFQEVGRMSSQRSTMGGRPEYLGSTLALGASQGALVVKNLPVNAGDIRDTDSIPG